MSDFPMIAEPTAATRRVWLGRGLGVAACSMFGGATLLPSSASAAAANAYGGDYSGIHLYAGGPGNTRIQGRVAWRFRCERSGFVRGVRWWNRMGTGYSTGSGGALVIEVRDDAGGRPGSRVLARSAVIGSPLKIGQWPETPLSALAQLQAGSIYHITFTNTAPSRGYTSVNNLHCNAVPATWSAYPYLEGALATMKSSSNSWSSGSWTTQAYYRPIFDLCYTDGARKGQGWIAGGRNYQNPIGGSRKAAQSLVVTPGRRVASISLCIYHRGSGGSGVDVEVLSGSTVLVRRTLPASSFSYSSNGDKASLKWATLPVSGTLSSGTCTVRLGSNGQYWVMPIKSGRTYGFGEDKLLTASGGCKYSTNGGGSWGTWPAGPAAGSTYNIPVLLRYA